MSGQGVDYTNYLKMIENVCKFEDLTYFKSHPDYTYVLEHTGQGDGLEYLNLIKKRTKIAEAEIKAFCSLNDSIGNPHKVNFGFVNTAPSNLRYIFHSHLILSHISSLKLPVLNIVEVGGGYGGLALCLDFFSKSYGVRINSYTIVDLKAPNDLQRLYVSKVNPKMKVDFVDGASFGKDIELQDAFLISNYCFSELDDERREQYEKNLFSKVAHGFMCWNMIPLYNFGFNVRDETEYPLTGDFNKYVYF